MRKINQPMVNDIFSEIYKLQNKMIKFHFLKINKFYLNLMFVAKK